ncbi:MAG TPA: tRNA (5-methylaminomethyl-2-thiouridine)(34)-methyltransferase MnmD [Burkholderiales bacterium]|nr:tRNA (5-methylaminomethyl-2-thiouridine)(34)-methyltransferase MnmD [Burkholderiales bacterium]
MAEPLLPAAPAFKDGIPFSEAFQDVYHSVDGGIAQSRHVFLAGNDLPRRWAGRERFVIFETGFGLGLNFLATLQAWRRNPGRKLHYVAVEKHPFSLQDLRTLHARYPEVEEEAAQLHSAWPMLVPGGHRAELEPDVVLTLFFADIKVVRDLRLSADALYLDGFAPDRNPDMWSHPTLRAVSRLAAPGATVATWSVAAGVRSALEETGFAVEKRPGFGAKREMLVATYRGRRNEVAVERRERKATVVGAGIAGASVCERLCARGWEVTLVERHAAPAQEASGNLAGAFHPVVTPDDSVFARVTRAGYLAALRTFASLRDLRWDPCGVLQLARNGREEESQRASIAALGLPPDYAQLVSADEASRHAGVALPAGGVWFPGAGWVQPRSLVDALLAACGPGLIRRFSSQMSTRPEGITILATAAAEIPHARLRRVRGQLSYLPSGAVEPPHVVVLRGGMILPPVEGICVTGASFDLEDEDPSPRVSSHEGNLERLARILPVPPLDPASLDGRVAFRAVARDRLPLAGHVDESTWALLALGSRGLTWASLGAELIASMLEAEPLPVEGKLADALAPLRFMKRAGSPAKLPSRP